MSKKRTSQFDFCWSSVLSASRGHQGQKKDPSTNAGVLDFNWIELKKIMNRLQK